MYLEYNLFDTYIYLVPRSYLGFNQVVSIYLSIYHTLYHFDIYLIWQCFQTHYKHKFKYDSNMYCPERFRFKKVVF